jgi:hypothetical protein
MPKMMECPDCNGTGEVDGDPCPTCEGEGEVAADYKADDAYWDKEFSAKERETLAEKGQAMKGGGFPIRNKADLQNAIRAIGRAKNPAAAKAHIKKRAKALGLSDLIPETWGDAMVKSVHMADALLEFDDRAGLKLTRDGYLVAQPRIARTGIQIYKGIELGVAQDEVRVYRPQAEVFSKDSIASFGNRPITLEHPQDFVTAANWSDFAVGHTDDEILRDGEFIRIPMMVMDAAAIDAIRDGKRQLSVGYSADLKWKKGFTDEGEAYDAIQTNIRANHLAIVASARGFRQLGDTRDPHGRYLMTVSSLIGCLICMPEMSDTVAWSAGAANPRRPSC